MMKDIEKQLLLIRLEFLNTLNSAGIEFEVHAIDGYLTLQATDVLDYLQDPDTTLARRRNVSLEEWMAWKKWVDVGHHENLIDFINKRPDNQPRRSKKIPDDLRWEVWERDDFRCCKCGIRRNLSIDHIVPISKGGKTEKSNLQTLCTSCNSSKGNGESVT